MFGLTKGGLLQDRSGYRSPFEVRDQLSEFLDRIDPDRSIRDSVRVLR